jgi:hypothetical protein
MLGTPEYMAPEQIADAAKADIRADLYSLGCTLYFLLSGRPPFQADSLYALLHAHHTKEAVPLNQARADVPAGLAAAVAKLMAKDPARRYRQPAEAARALAPFFRTGLKPLVTVPADAGTPAPTAATHTVKPPAARRAQAAAVPTPAVLPTKVDGKTTIDGAMRAAVAGTTRQPQGNIPRSWLLGAALGAAGAALVFGLVVLWAGRFGTPGAGPDAAGKGSNAANVQTGQQPGGRTSKTSQVAQAFKKPPAKQELKVPATVSGGKEAKAGPEAVADAAPRAKKREDKAHKDAEYALPKTQKEGKGVVKPGEGGGSGSKKGLGNGTNPNGGDRSKQQRRELRWRIDFSGTGEQHLAKLRALGITLAVPTGVPGRFLVMDLSRNPPASAVTDLSRQLNKVKWFNTKAESVRELARVLRLPTAPPYAVIFLPAKMEQEMIDLEHRYKGLEETQIERTDFEIQQRRDGSYGPVVVRQVPKGR